MTYAKSNVATLLEMLRYRRQADSKSHRKFQKRFLVPVFGQPDEFGNYMRVVGDNPKPRIAFMAHHDSVHRGDGMQRLIVSNDQVMLASDKESNCLGADCATGVWLMLEMIVAGVSGRYVVHADEESGGIGARRLVRTNPAWLAETDFAISFDRKGYNEIITHQYGSRTCSDEFARDLGELLGGGWVADDTGVFTDSACYESDIPECTNISVGYLRQHSPNETQCLYHAAALRDALIAADWASLTPYRDPITAPLPTDATESTYRGETLHDLVWEHAELAADYLLELGVDAREFAEYVRTNGSLNLWNH